MDPGPLMDSSEPEPGVFARSASGRNYFGQEKAFFNSELTTRTGFGGNATLTIYLRLYLMKRDWREDIVPRATDDKGLEIEVVPWGTPTDSGRAYDFAEFTRGVKEEAEKFWDNANLCLVPPPDYRALEYSLGDQKVRPNIDCRFKIVWAGRTQDAHAVIDCFCPKRPREFRSNVGENSDGTLGGQWTCYDLSASLNGMVIHDGAECQGFVGDPLGDMSWKTYRCDKELAREAVCHEVGHLLGLSHVGEVFKTPACTAELAKPHGTNAIACYIGPTNSDTENIMGAGDKIAI
jgi:hypothetical protein